MREIKFRAWCNNMKAMVDVMDVHFSKNNGYIKTPSSGFSKNFTLLQYTGLKDKNDTEIYEGDIVGFNNHAHLVDFRGGSFVVVYPPENRKEIEGECLTDNLDVFFKCFKGEVIGNIYENPELIENS